MSETNATTPPTPPLTGAMSRAEIKPSTAAAPTIGTFSAGRGAIVFVVITLLFLALVGRVAYLQTLGRARIVAWAERQQHQKETLQSRRGSIFDRNGLLLAGSVQKQALFVDPKMLHEHFQTGGRSLVDLDKAIAQIGRIVAMDPFDITQKISDRDTTRYVRIVEGLDDDAVAELKSLKIPGLGFEPCSARVYPMGNIAAHVLGGMRADGKGLEGVELKFDPLLSGHDGYKRSLKDARRRSIGAMADDYLAPEHGRHLVLTLDANIQMIVQQELNDVCTKYRAKTAEAVVMDPRTGEIVALANWPTFSPQNLEDSNAQVWTNRAIVVPYEPGSTIKPFIVGPALAWKAVQATDILPIHGPARHLGYGGRVVKDVATYPQLAVWDVIVKSSNIGMTYVAEKLGTFRLHAAVTQFGFGKFTGVELPGENHGRVNPLSKWTRFTQDSMAQGYELMVTPLQLARAMCAYANGGKLVEPKLVRGVLEPDGVTIQSVTPLDRAKMTQVIDKSTADTMRRILADVMVRGTGTKGRSSIYTIFGKTGTAHRAVGGSYNESNYTASFCGGAPYENPRLVVAIVVHDPDKSLAHYGGVISAPVAQRVLERSLAYLQVPPSPLLAPPAEQYAKVLYNFDPKLYDRKQPKNNPATANVHD